jgi:hypothetical protein
MNQLLVRLMTVAGIIFLGLAPGLWCASTPASAACPPYCGDNLGTSKGDVGTGGKGGP